MKYSTASCVAVVVFLSCSPGSADFVAYDQSEIAYGSPVGADISSHRTAEQFVLGSTTQVTGFSIFLSELGQSLTPGVLEGFQGLGWALYSGSGEPIGNPITGQWGNVSVGQGTLTDTGINSDPNRDVFRFDFDIPLADPLGPGHYWLAIVENGWGQAHDGVAIAWYTTTNNLDASYRQKLFDKNLPVAGSGGFPANYTGQGLAFQVHGSSIPEPGALGVVICLGAWISLKRRRVTAAR